MSTVKIKTEPATATAAAVDLQVKLEPSLSTADIKLEQHTSDIDIKAESDSEADIRSESEEDDIKSEDDADSDQVTITPKKQRRFICEYPGCGCRFISTSCLRMHQHEHKLQTELNIRGKTYILTRLSLDDRWLCPIQGCTSTANAANSMCTHIRKIHIKTKRQQNQQHSAQITQRNHYFLDVDDFYIHETRYGYHTTTGLFICYKCKLVPECLLTHLQQKHGYDEKSIDNSVLPKSAVNASADPNINQHTSNPYLTAAISQPHWQHHKNIVHGWLCVTSDCEYCGLTASTKSKHKRDIHHGEHLTTIPALVLRFVYTKTQTTCFLITRIDTVAISSNRVNQHKLDYSHNGLNSQDGSEDDTSQNETTEESNQKKQWKCEYPNCGLFFNSAKLLSSHRREHKHEVVINVQGTTYTLSRHSSDERWICPVPNCDVECKTVDAIRKHMQRAHSTSIKQKRANNEDDDNQQQKRQIIKRRQCTIQYLKVDDFYVSGTRCGYHTLTGLFICHECRLVPECLLTHLQQKHGFDEKSLDNSVLPESAVNAGADSSSNQHTSNPHLAAAIREPHRQQHQDIVQGWLCVTSECGYCGYSVYNKRDHRKRFHQGEPQSTIPALVLRLLYGKIQTSGFLITRLDTAFTNTNSDKSNNSASQNSDECDDDDGDELVLSDYSDEDDIH